MKKNTEMLLTNSVLRVQLHSIVLTNFLSFFRLVKLFVFALLIFSCVFGTAQAEDITLSSAVVINSANKLQYEGKSVAGTIPSDSSAGGQGFFISPGAIVVDGIELNLTIDGLNVDYSEANSMRSGISLVNGATLHLTVNGENTLTAGYGGAGIAVPAGCTLEITSASTGTLNATGGKNYGGGAGIGSIGDRMNTDTQANLIYPQGLGTIIINGGTINAQGGTWYYNYTAAGGAAGIGGGNGGTLLSITITGGTVTATTGMGTSLYNAAAIGLGFNGISSGSGTLTCPEIKISGGNVTANGNIGYGEARDATQNIGGSITVNGVLTVNNGELSAGTVNADNWKHSVSFEANRGTGSMETEILQHGASYLIPECTFTPPDGKYFVNWIIDGTSYAAPGNSITVNNSITVKAQWEDFAVITFDSNGGSGQIQSQSVKKGTSYTLPECTFTPPDKKYFVNWTINDASYNPRNSITVNSSITVKAQWEDYAVITFDANGGSGEMQSQSVKKGTSYTLPECTFTPPDGKFFSYWVREDGSTYYPGKTSYIQGNTTSITFKPNWATTTVWSNETIGVASDMSISDRVIVTGNVVLEIQKGATLTLPQGINVAEGNTLTIQGEGTLLIDRGSDNSVGANDAGIGGNDGQNCGTVIIEGGIINITKRTTSSGGGGACIGGGHRNGNNGGGCGTITINGGEVTAEITTGTIIAIGGTDGTININGGKVTATSTIGDGSSVQINLSYSRPGDYIQSKSYIGTVTLLKEFKLADTGETATTDNIGGKKIIPARDTVTVTFNSKGGSEVAAQTIFKDDKAEDPAAPTRTDYYFRGWYLNEDFSGTAYDFNTAVTDNITLYAKWADPAVWGKTDSYTPDGSESKPYIISNADGWNLLVDELSSGNDYGGQFFRLSEDLTVTTMLGTSGKGFAGTFEGNGRTLTFSYDGTDDYCAPFRYVNGGTIKNLTVSGTIKTSGQHIGGIVGQSDCATKIENCKFIGKLLTTANTIGGGFVAENNGTLTINQSLYAPATIETDEAEPSATGTTTFSRNTESHTSEITASYYLRALGEGQGKMAYAISGGTGITVALANDSANGFIYDKKIYAGENEAVSLTISGGSASETGYAFKGYKASAGTLTESNGKYSLAMSAQDTMISAEFKRVYSVIISSTVMNGTVETDKSQAVSGDTIKLTVTPSTGYSVSRVKYNDTAITSSDNTYSFTMPDSNVTITATFTPKSYSITYNLNGGTNNSGNPTSYTIESSTITLKAPARTGYKFTDWTPNGVINSGSTGDKNFTANWTAQEYKISFDLNGGKLGTDQNNPTSYDINSENFSPANPTREGYEFEGWLLSGDTTGAVSKDLTVPNGSTGDREYIAQWKAIKYSISYGLDGGTVSPDNPASYTAESADIKLTNPTRNGYDFTGWSFDAKISLDVTIPKGSTGDKNFSAIWSLITYPISYDLNGGNLSTANPTGYTAESNSITLNNPTRTGYNFKGWTGSNGTTPQTSVTIQQGSTGNKTFKADWTAVEYSITYELNNGNLSTANPTGYTIESNAITLNNPNKNGYQFDGWTGTNLTAKTQTVTIAKGSTGNRSYTANFTPIKYSITYNLDGGTNNPGNPAEYTVEDLITLKDPTKTGYDFNGGLPREQLTKAARAIKLSRQTGRLKKAAKILTPNPLTLISQTPMNPNLKQLRTLKKSAA